MPCASSRLVQIGNNTAALDKKVLKAEVVCKQAQGSSRRCVTQDGEAGVRSMFMVDERRRHARTATDSSVRYRVIPGVRLDLQGAHLRDYSPGGVRFRTLEYLPLGARMLLELHLPSSPPVRAFGRAAWVRMLPGTSGFEVGGQLEFPDAAGPDSAAEEPGPHGLA